MDQPSMKSLERAIFGLPFNAPINAPLQFWFMDRVIARNRKWRPGRLNQFTSPVTALGLDVLAYGGFPNNTTVSVFGTDDATLLATIGPIFGSGNTPILHGFAEFSDAMGIGELLVSVGRQHFGPVIDNLEFAAVPERSGLALFGSALVCLNPATAWQAYGSLTA
jgi:hypothetical protein